MNLISLKLQSLDRRKKLSIIILNDFFLGLICWIVFGPPMATFIASEFSSSLIEIFILEWKSFLIPIFASITYLYILGFYRSLIKFFDSKDSIFLSLTGSLIFGFVWAIIHIYQFRIISTSFLSVAILQGMLLSAVFYAFLNISRDVAKFLLYPHLSDDDAKSIVIYGAGESGNELLPSVLLDRSKKLLAFFDDSKDLKDRQINNIPILGRFDQLKELKEKHPDLEVLLAIPSIDTDRRRKIISKLEKIKVAVRTVPSFHELISDQKKMTDIQNLSLDDLLPRARISKNLIGEVKNKNLLITGAGGSIGSEISRQLLENDPRSIIIFDNSEYNLFLLERECIAIKSTKGIATKVIPILGDIRDIKTLQSVFSKFNIQSVFHAAAYKHVPLVEMTHNITSACENNIVGTYNLAKVSIDNTVESFVMISTDKAVRPSNVMGASKRMAEMVIQSLNTETSQTKFSMVRFGNVLNSSGSVIPTFLDQISRGGPVTVTDKNVTRYFMTIPEASNLVLQASQMANGGEVFILDMGDQLKIYDIARKLVHLSGRNISSSKENDGIEIVEIGLRPGEKMYEELLISGEQQPTKHPKIFKSMENFPSLDLMNDLIDLIKLAIKDDDHSKLIGIMSENVEGYYVKNL